MSPVPGDAPGDHGQTDASVLRVAVVGAGIAGLSAASRLVDHARAAGTTLSLDVYEAAPRAGGHILTETTDDGFLIEGGPDCFVSQKPGGVRLTEQLGLSLQSTEPVSTTFVLSDGRLHPLPEGTMLMVPTKFMPLARSGLLSWPGKVRMGFDLLLPRGGAPDESLGTFVTRRLGGEALEKIAEPLVAGVHAGDPDRLSLMSTFPRFKAMETDHRSLILAMVGARRARVRTERERPKDAELPPSAFVTVAGGLERLVDRLVEALPAGSLHLGTAVTALERSGAGYRVQTLGPARDITTEVDAVVLTTPAHEAADLVRGLNADLSRELAGIEAVSAATVNLGFRRTDVEHPLNGFGLVIPRREGRRVMGVTWSSSKFPGRAPAGTVLLRVFVGGVKGPAALALDDEHLLDLVMAELRDLLGVRGLPVVSRLYRWERAMPQYNVGHGERLARIDAALARSPGLALAGGPYRGIGIPDCIAGGQAAAESVLGATGCR